ncbi:MAG: hypothetical protein A4E25_00456 [Methanobacterium sp. PtaB.Bin024]|nr:MAG: hypothetical protein A4E25_00456 [Methanobacterium sp. PtaB.Bin024]
MKHKAICILMVFLLIFGFLSFSFARNYGQDVVQSVSPPPTETTTEEDTPSGGSPVENQSGGGNQTTTTSTTIQTGTVFVNQKSQDLVVIRKVSNTTTTTNTTTTSTTENKCKTDETPNEPDPDPLPLFPIEPGKRLFSIIGYILESPEHGVRDPDWPYTNSSNDNLWIADESYSDGVTNSLRQTTSAGSIPHQVADSNGATYYAFCMEPGQKAQVGENLTNTDAAPAVIYDLVKKSDPEDDDNAYKTQLKIWALLTGGNISSSGEVAVLKENMGISDDQFKEDVKTATNELKKEYGSKDGQITPLLDYRTVNIFGYNMLENLFTGIKHLFGWYTSYQPLSQSLVSPYNGDTSQQATSTNTQSTQNTQNTQTSKDQTNTPTPVQPGPGEISCSNCGGTGQIQEWYTYSEWVPCTRCGGSGQIYDSIEGVYITCPSCHGSKGSYVEKTGTRWVTCPVCGGDGVI